MFLLTRLSSPFKIPVVCILRYLMLLPWFLDALFFFPLLCPYFSLCAYDWVTSRNVFSGSLILFSGLVLLMTPSKVLAVFSLCSLALGGNCHFARDQWQAMRVHGFGEGRRGSRASCACVSHSSPPATCCAGARVRSFLEACFGLCSSRPRT